MPTLEFIFRNGRLDLRVEHRGVMRFVHTLYEVREREWDAENGWLVLGNMGTARHRKLLCYQRAMARDLRCLRAAVTGMQRPSADDIASEYRRIVAGCQMLGTYAQILSGELARESRPRTARGYITAIRRFIDFNNGYDIRLDGLTTEVVVAFEHALESEGLTPPTISFYMRTLRAIYNRAVAECITPARFDNPFEEAYTRIEMPLRLDVAGAT